MPKLVLFNEERFASCLSVSSLFVRFSSRSGAGRKWWPIT